MKRVIECYEDKAIVQDNDKYFSNKKYIDAKEIPEGKHTDWTRGNFTGKLLSPHQTGTKLLLSGTQSQICPVKNLNNV